MSALSLLTLCVFGIFAQPTSLPEIDEVRGRFYKSVQSETEAKAFYQELNAAIGSLPPLYQGYLGASEALLAKHSWNPYKKLDYLKQSQITLAKAIEQLPHDLELRFLRFSIQHYLPSFLGASGDIEEDKRVIIQQLQLKNYKKQPTALVKNVINFLIESKRCSKEQEKFLSDLSQTI